MDLIEMTQFMLVLLQREQIFYPEKPKPTMRELIHQMSVFAEHKTEQGSINYYAPGSEKDSLVKAQLICCFAARKQLSQTTPDLNHVIGGIGRKQSRFASTLGLQDYKRDSDIVEHFSKRW